MAWAMRDAQVETSTQRLVLIALADSIRSPKSYCWVSQQTLASAVKLNVDTVGRTIKRLAELGLVRIETRTKKDGSRDTNYYHLPTIELKASFKNEEPPRTSDTPPAQSRMGDEDHPTLSRVPPRTESEEPIHKSNLQRATPYKPPKGGGLALVAEPGKETYSEGFERFWKVFPSQRKGSKADAFKVWQRSKLEQHTEFIVQDVESKVESHRKWLDGYAPAATTYLNKRGWTEDLETTGSQGHAKETPFERTQRLQRESREDLIERARNARFDF